MTLSRTLWRRSAPAIAALIACAVPALPAAAAIGDVPAGAYKAEMTHAYINFSYTHLGFSNPVVGFKSFDIALDLNQDDPTASSLSVTIDPASVDSRVEVFDGHLVSEDWFNVEAHPEITFVATDIEMTGDSTMAITGDLTIKGITKAVTLDATINKAAPHPFRKTPTIGISASADLLRSDFDLGNYAPAVSDEVTVNIQVEMIPDAE